jgi:hypothetical protein
MARPGFRIYITGIKGQEALNIKLLHDVQSIWNLDTNGKIRDYATDTLQALAKKLVKSMEGIIENNRKRPKASGRSNLVMALRDSIKLQREGNNVRVYIGNVEELNERAPYWYILNYGGRHPASGIKVPGFFDGGKRPMKGEGGEYFTYAQRTFMMIPSKPIEGIRYLNIAVGWLDTYWGKQAVAKRKALKTPKKVKTQKDIVDAVEEESDTALEVLRKARRSVGI